MKYHFNLALTLMLCCSQAFSASAPRGKNRPNIVLITMDTLRADHLGCYGYTEIKTPALDALAGDGLLYQNAFALVERSARQSLDHALNWLGKQSASRPFFLWLHLYDPHSPYHPPEPYATEYKSYPYDGEIAYADAQLGRLIAGLKASHRYASTL